MLDVGVGIGAATWQLRRITHANEVRSDTASKAFQRGDDVAPEVGRGRVAMQEDNGVASAHLYIGHLESKHLLKLFRIRKGCVRHTIPSSFLKIAVIQK